ncbi:hypothetical protein EW145_g3222 [Phellinidium pouzarii]|uniref:Uncharacterized protein n=1 Tax=Phellinidium pouzarii TaxID=167371 RepID=A0A4V3XCY9_9AGAM|nr:hypothetical protein EW145_g3222 [Phellinidium pouzarii]
MSSVNVDFTNTGNEITMVLITDQSGRSTGPLIIRPNQIVRHAVPLFNIVSLTYTRGRFEQYASQSFTKNETIDVNKYFV